MKFLKLSVFVLFVFGCSEKKAERPGTQEILLTRDGAVNSTPKPHAVALIEDHCCRCHNSKKKKGKVDLQSFLSNSAPLRNVKLWSHALDQTENQVMPPEGKRQPTKEERAQIISWLDNALKKTYMQMPDDPGRTVVRRLNRQEYNQTLKDLLKIDKDLAVDLPLDSVGYGFDNIAELMSVPPLLMEKYMAAARTGLDAAVSAAGNPNKKIDLNSSDFKVSGNSGRSDSDALILWASGTASSSFKLAYGSRYRIKFRAWGDQAGSEPVKVDVKIGSRKVKTISIKNKKYSPGEFTLETEIPKGSHSLSISFINDYYDSKAKKDRNFYLDWAYIEGPLKKVSLPESHRTLLSMTPNSSISEDQAAWFNIKNFLNRAFRTKVNKDEITKYFELYKKIKKKGRNFEYSLKMSFMAALVSPRFLFRMETKPSRISKAGDHELAVRLSYFLHSSMPDEKLLELADLKLLSKPQVFRREAMRLLSSDKMKAFSANFAGQWLQLRSLDRLHPDMKLYPEWNWKLREAMKKESIHLFAEILSKNLPMEKFITYDEIYINDSLADHYKIPGVKGSNFRVVKAPEGRGGILTQASVLTVTSMPARTSPVKRGKWVMEEVLGTPPPPPPEDVSPLEETAKINPNLSLKKKLELHREDDVCASCHKTMDAIGFSFENYDALGKWRTKINGKPVDSGGVLPNGVVLDNPGNLKSYITSKKEKFVKHMIGKLMVYALGRGLEESDFKAIYGIMDKTRADNYRFKDVVVAITESVPFQYKKP